LTLAGVAGPPYKGTGALSTGVLMRLQPVPGIRVPQTVKRRCKKDTGLQLTIRAEIE